MGAPGEVKKKYARPGIPHKIIFNLQNPLLLPLQKNSFATLPHSTRQIILADQRYHFNP
jgi:hypothetical protein